ncbi:MAG: cupin domain-containing protein [Patescibacteria group bacterium]
MQSTIKKDPRGDMCFVEGNSYHCNVVETKKGMKRGGHSHPCDQYTVIIQGKMRVMFRQNGVDDIMIKEPGEVIHIPAGIPHLFEALEDSVFIEWMFSPYEAKEYPPYRKLVEK